MGTGRETGKGHHMIQDFPQDMIRKVAIGLTARLTLPGHPGLAVRPDNNNILKGQQL